MGEAMSTVKPQQAKKVSVAKWSELADRHDPVRRAHVERAAAELQGLDDPDFRRVVRRLRAQTV